ncbi:MAG: hypothetical protein A2170_17460 [Deltaproteobacteria bacterium RBG_13_53_10]|nr:MAG: hypothetical protein A2170_17460 [Deltaproteobacteria bacterium RBG_13_53_10]
MSLAAAGVIVVIAVMTYLPTKGSEPSTSTSGAPLVLAPAVSSPPVNPSPQGKEHEVEKIKALLDNIRKANLHENIDLFMSCYALDFKDREEKKRSTIETWKNFNYMDLSYNVKNQTVSGDTASIEVEWLTKISQDKDSQPRENRTVIDASLKKEDGNWRIKETRTAS